MHSCQLRKINASLPVEENKCIVASEETYLHGCHLAVKFNPLVPKRCFCFIFIFYCLNPLVTDAHYSERQDKPFSLQIQQLEVD